MAAVGCSSPATVVPPSPTAVRSASGSPSASVAPSPAATESNPPGDIPDNQAYVPYAVATVGVTVKVPEGWARTTSHSTVEFSDKLNRIDLSATKVSTAPTVQSAIADLIPQLRSATPKFAPGSVTAERRAGQPVILIRYQGDSPQNPVTGKVVRDAFERYIYFRAGSQLDLTLAGPTNADNVDPWRIVSDSVTWQ